MTTRRRSAGVAIATLGALMTCMTLPMPDPSCTLGLMSAHASLGCDAASMAAPRAAILVALGLGIALAVGMLVSILRQALDHHRVSEALRRTSRPAILGGRAVGLAFGIAGACVAGVRRPGIYCSADLASQLDDDELRAVLLHEQHHQLTHAPARLVVLAGLASIVGRIDDGRAWLERRRANIEIAADRHAIRAGAERPVLARALLKLDGPAPAVSLVGFTSAVDLRVRALLGEPVAERSTGSGPGPVLFAIAGSLAVLVCRAGGST